MSDESPAVILYDSDGAEKGVVANPVVVTSVDSDGYEKGVELNPVVVDLAGALGTGANPIVVSGTVSASLDGYGTEANPLVTKTTLYDGYGSETGIVTNPLSADVVLYDSGGNEKGLETNPVVVELSDALGTGLNPVKTTLYDGGGTETGTAPNPLITEGKSVLYDSLGSPITGANPLPVSATVSVTAGDTVLVDGDGYDVGTETNPFIVSQSYYGLSAFGEQRVVTPYTLADLTNKYELDTREYGTQTATGGTVAHVATDSAIRLTVTGSNGSSAKLRTHTFYRYQAGKGMLIKQTVYHSDAGQANQIRRWGFFDDNDGVFWELDGTILRVVRRTSVSGVVSDNAIAQSSWNADKANGTGTSGFNLDLTKGNIYEIQFAWLGSGQIRFFINGILAHEIRNQNLIAGPYMRTAQLPLHFEVINLAASTGASMTNICSSVISEGGQNPPGYSYGIANPVDITVTPTEKHMLSIRLKSTYNGITNRMVILPQLLNIHTEGARASYYIYFNATLTAPSWVSVAAQSGIEYDISASAFTGGELLSMGFLANLNDRDRISLQELFSYDARKLRLNAFATASDILTVTGKKEDAGGNTAMRANLIWKEIR